jgi:hypothetical protein
MPHAIADIDAKTTPHLRRQSTRALPREVQKLFTSLGYLQVIYSASELSRNITQQLHASVRGRTTPISSIVSLGLGGFLVTKWRSRRLKQLTILLAMKNDLENISATKIVVYAQDPSFTRADEAFLKALGIRLLRTSSITSLDEAELFISPSTLVYTPFLTLEVYEQLLRVARVGAPIIFGDDFDVLMNKWPRRSPEHDLVETLTRKGLSGDKRRVIQGKGFWEEVDESSPMALYDASDSRRSKLRGSARI